MSTLFRDLNAHEGHDNIPYKVRCIDTLITKCDKLGAGNTTVVRPMTLDYLLYL